MQRSFLLKLAALVAAILSLCLFPPAASPADLDASKLAAIRPKVADGTFQRITSVAVSVPCHRDGVHVDGEVGDPIPLARHDPRIPDPVETHSGRLP